MDTIHGQFQLHCNQDHPLDKPLENNRTNKPYKSMMAQILTDDNLGMFVCMGKPRNSILIRKEESNPCTTIVLSYSAFHPGIL